MKKHLQYIFAFLVGTLFFINKGYAQNAACAGECSGCASWYYLIPASSNEIKNAFRAMEARVAQRYQSDILPLEKDIRLLEKEVMRKIAHIQAIEEKTLLLQMKMGYHTDLLRKIEATRTSILETKNKGKNK